MEFCPVDSRMENSRHRATSITALVGILDLDVYKLQRIHVPLLTVPVLGELHFLQRTPLCDTLSRLKHSD